MEIAQRVVPSGCFSAGLEQGQGLGQGLGLERAENHPLSDLNLTRA